MRKRLIALVVFFVLASNSFAAVAASGTGACYYGRFGQSVDCGGGYVVPVPSDSANQRSPETSPASPSTPAPAISPLLAFDIACLANVSGAASAGSAPICVPPTGQPAAQPAAVPAAAPAPTPADYAVQFWRTIPLPVPKPAVPPGYAITGKPAYLVTNGTVAPPVYTDQTPLGTLTIEATGRYLVDWGDSTPPAWDGPYPEEGQPWPDGKIVHTYDYAGTYTIQVEEDWTAVWHLGAATGTLTGLRTTADIPGFQARQLQAVVTN